MIQQVYASKPIAAWNKEIRTDFKRVFIHLAMGALRMSSGGWKEALMQALELLTDVELAEDDCASHAWLLIHRALTEALFQLAEAYWPTGCQTELTPEELVASLHLEQTLEQQPVCLDEQFFLHPEQCAVLQHVQEPFCRWLLAHGFAAAQAQAISERLPSYFVLALHHQWRIKADQYRCLQQNVATPFTRAAAREQGWNHYRAWLQKQIDEPLFGSCCSLRSLYVPLRGCYWDRAAYQAQASERAVNGQVIDLQAACMQWIREAPAEDAVRLLAGEAGSGKTVFVKMLAANLAIEGKIPVLLIPVRLFGKRVDLVQTVREFVAADPCCHDHSPLQEMAEQDRLLLILDGLEELAVQQQSIVEKSMLWIEEIRRCTARLNQRTTRLQVMITCREPLSSRHRELLSVPGQWIRLLGYAPLPGEALTTTVNSLAAVDQRPLWWQRYQQASPAAVTTPPYWLAASVPSELTAYPLANHLFVATHRPGEGSCASAHKENLLYQQLCQAIYHRRYENGHHALLLGWDEQHFFTLLEELAVTLWHGQRWTATLSELQQTWQTLPAHLQHRVLPDNPLESLWRLLTAFDLCCVAGQEEGEERFAFTRLGMAHYLTVRRILRLLRQISSQRKIHRLNPERGWDDNTALAHWLRLCGAAELTLPMIRLLHDEIALHAPRQVWEWQKQLAGLLGYVLRHGLPLLDESFPGHYRVLEERCHRAEAALLAVLNGCARHTERRSPRWAGEGVMFARWLNRLRPQRSADDDGLGVLAWLSHLDLRGVTWRFADLYGADLRQSDLRGADLWGANLAQACLEGADLRGAELLHANLQGARMQQVQVALCGK
ncbi:MAG: pentapeptide repeat-containing protein [Magnetococcales bacterium]|nr:pentapeptide repeat-containing protein [Magnetococcales bacterium]